MDNWYLVYCKPREEFRAQQHLSNLGFSTYLPVLHKTKFKNTQAVQSTELLFPRYLFLQAHTEANLAVVKNTRGVSDFVRFGGKIAQVPAALIQQLTAQQIELQNTESAKFAFEQGQPLQITHGPYAGLSAIFQMADGAGRCLVLIQLLNTAVSLSLQLDEIKTADKK